MLLGDLVTAAYDRAARRSGDPAEVSRLASRAVRRALRSARRKLVFAAASRTTSAEDDAER